MGLQDPYGNDQTSYNEPTGSVEFDRGNQTQYGPQPQNQLPSTITPLTPDLYESAYGTVGPGGESLGSMAQDQYYENLAQNLPGFGEFLGAGMGAAGGTPVPLVGLVKNMIQAGGQSTQQTIQSFVERGMSLEDATGLVNYSMSPNTYTGPDRNDDPTQSSFLSPENVNGGGPGGYGSMEEYIRSVTPQATDILTGGTESAVTREQQALQESLDLLSPYAGDEAYQETAALTGALGEEAQRAAITGIPLSEAQRAAQEREQRQQMRLAGAAGRAGGGATVQEMINLGGRQQAETVSDRLQQLSPIADINRQTASTMSGLEEGSLTRQAQLEQQLGPQLAAILMGQTGPITETRSSAAELSGLQNVNEAQQNSQLMAQIAEMIGSWSGGSNAS